MEPHGRPFCSKSIGNGIYNLISVWFNKILNIFLCVPNRCLIQQFLRKIRKCMVFVYAGVFNLLRYNSSFGIIFIYFYNYRHVFRPIGSHRYSQKIRKTYSMYMNMFNLLSFFKLFLFECLKSMKIRSSNYANHAQWKLQIFIFYIWKKIDVCTVIMKFYDCYYYFGIFFWESLF